MNNIDTITVVQPVPVAPFWYQVHAPVILDKEITMTSKVVYALISGLTVKEGYCWASNEWIGNELGISKQTVSRCISELEEKGHIISMVEQSYRRKITLSYIEADSQKRLGGYSKMTRGVVKNDEGDSQKRLYNNTNELDYINTLENKRFTTPTVEEVSSYCLERNNEIDAQSFIDYYSARGWMLGKNKMKDWKASVRTWENRSLQDKQKGKKNVDNTIEAVNNYIRKLG